MEVPINLGAPAIKVEAVLKDELPVSLEQESIGGYSPSTENLSLKPESIPNTLVLPSEIAPAPPNHAAPAPPNHAAPAPPNHAIPAKENHILRDPDLNLEDAPRPFPCNQCAVSFVNRLQLAVHERMHLTDKALPCPECGVVFYLPLALARHQRLHQLRQPQEPKDERRRSQRSKVPGVARLRVTCGGCEEEFEETHLRDHHVGYFWCARCKRVFGLRCKWRKHGCPGRPGRPPAYHGPPSPDIPDSPRAKKRRGRPPKAKHRKPKRPRASSEDMSSFDPDNLLYGWDDDELGGTGEPDGPPPEGLRCELCDLTFVSERGARRHYDAKHSNQSYDCEVCERKFNRLDSLVTHSLDAHRQPRQFPCTHCSRMFTQQRIIQYHVARAHSKQRRANGEDDGLDVEEGELGAGPSGDWEGYKCDDCGRTFRNRVRLAEHRHSVHEEPGHRFQCELCPSSYTRVDELTKHTIAVHNQEKTHHCDKCNKASFTQKSLLEYHQKLHDIPHKPRKIRQFKCKVCKRRFSTEPELTEHECTGPPEPASTRRPICDICGRACCNTGALRRHQLHHSTERPAVCDVCGARFVDKYALTQHKITHSTERPHVCHICGKGFRVKGTFMRHVKFHSNERPHVCEQCGKAFKTSLTLMGHMRIHTGEKPFVCQVCSRPFRLPHQLKTHMKVHEPGRTKKAKGQEEWENSAAAASSAVASSVASPETERSLPSAAVATAVPVRPPWLSAPSAVSQDSQERAVAGVVRPPWLHGPGAPPMPVVAPVVPAVPSPGSDRSAGMSVPRPPWM